MKVEYLSVSELCECLSELIEEGYGNRPTAIVVPTKNGFTPAPITKCNLGLLAIKPADEKAEPVPEIDSAELFQENADSTACILRVSPPNTKEWTHIFKHAKQNAPTIISPPENPSELSTLMPVVNGTHRGAWYYLPMKAGRDAGIPHTDYKVHTFVDLATRDMWWFIESATSTQEYTADTVKEMYASVSFAAGLKI